MSLFIQACKGKGYSIILAFLIFHPSSILSRRCSRKPEWEWHDGLTDFSCLPALLARE